MKLRSAVPDTPTPIPAPVAEVGRLQSLVVRLAVAYALLGLSVLGVFAGAFWLTTGKRTLDQIDRRVNVRETILEDIFQRNGLAALVGKIHRRVAQIYDSGDIFLLTDPAFKPIAGNLRSWPKTLSRQPGWDILPAGKRPDGAPIRVHHMLLSNGDHLLVGVDLGFYDSVRRLFFIGLGSTAVVLVLFGMGGGFLVRRAIIARLDALNQATVAIIGGDLSHRVAVRGRGDELDLLAATINRLLEQIKQLVEGVRNVSNVVAHDLRTPLSELRARLEDIVAHRPPPAETFVGVEAALRDTDRLLQLFNALLRLAEVDSGARRAGFVRLDLAKLVEEAAELYQPLAETKALHLRFKCLSPLYVKGDPTLLAQSLGNLVDNAVKYVPDGGSIRIQAEAASADEVLLEVSDNGPGVGPDEVDRVTQRFYRGDASRGTHGNGLGLSMVAAVARLHGAQLRLEDNKPGLRACLTLPRA